MILRKLPLTGLYKPSLLMIKQEVSQDSFDNLIYDAEYLVDEAEALKYVIDQVPYDEIPPGGMSIYQMLRYIDHAQTNYYRPIIEKVFSENRILRLSEFEHFQNSFEESPEDEPSIEKVLNRIVKHRAALINSMKKISLIDWERKLRGEKGDEMCLIDFAEKMIVHERRMLKKIADLVLIYQNERAHQREIDKKIAQRNNMGQQ